VSARLQPASGVRVFLLEDGGVLFSDPDQELHGLNAAAAWLWCQIEEGRGAEEAAQAFAALASLPPEEAGRSVGGLVEEWIERGWLVDAAAAAETTAAPTAREPRRPRGPVAQPDARRAGRTPLGPPPRFYRVFSTTVSVQLPDARAAAVVDPVLAHLEVGGAAGADVELEVATDEEGFVLFEDGEPVGSVGRREALAPAVKGQLRVLAVDREPYFMQIHAGVILAGDGGCLLLPGAPGSGKTTLTAGLVAAGFGYLSDEAALLVGDPLRVLALPLALTVKSGAVDVLAPLFPGLEGLPVHEREDGRRVRYLPPLGSPDRRATSHPARWIVFPRYAPDVETRLLPLAKPAALERLLACCLTLPDWLDAEGVGRLVALLRGVGTWELPLSSLAEGVRALEPLLGRAPGQPGSMRRRTGSAT
jgi:hypothetical protein